MQFNKYKYRCVHPEQQHLRHVSWLTFGKEIAKARKLRGFTQTDMSFAMRMNGEKVHAMDISRVENGIQIPLDDRRLNCFLAALNLPKGKENKIRALWLVAIREED